MGFNYSDNYCFNCGCRAFLIPNHYLCKYCQKITKFNKQAAPLNKILFHLNKNNKDIDLITAVISTYEYPHYDNLDELEKQLFSTALSLAKKNKIDYNSLLNAIFEKNPSFSCFLKKITKEQIQILLRVEPYYLSKFNLPDNIVNKYAKQAIIDYKENKIKITILIDFLYFKNLSSVNYVELKKLLKKTTRSFLDKDNPKELVLIRNFFYRRPYIKVKDLIKRHPQNTPAKNIFRLFEDIQKD